VFCGAGLFGFVAGRLVLDIPARDRDFREWWRNELVGGFGDLGLFFGCGFGAEGGDFLGLFSVPDDDVSGPVGGEDECAVFGEAGLVHPVGLFFVGLDFFAVGVPSLGEAVGAGGDELSVCAVV
jgi:hypothetical protein